MRVHAHIICESTLHRAAQNKQIVDESHHYCCHGYQHEMIIIQVSDLINIHKNTQVYDATTGLATLIK